MIVMSRCKNEAVVIGDNIRVAVLDIQDNAVRLGISALHQTPSYWEQTIFTTPETDESEENDLVPQDNIAFTAHI